MSRISESELEGYDIEFLKKMCLEVDVNENLIKTLNKNFLIKIIMWKEKQSEKWAIGEYEKYKEKLEKSKQLEPKLKIEKIEKESKYTPPHLRKEFKVEEVCMIDTFSDSGSDSFGWDPSYTGWCMPGDEMNTV